MTGHPSYRAAVLDDSTGAELAGAVDSHDAGRTLPPRPPLATGAALDHVATTWRAARPLTAWLDGRVGPHADAPS